MIKTELRLIQTNGRQLIEIIQDAWDAILESNTGDEATYIRQKDLVSIGICCPTRHLDSVSYINVLNRDQIFGRLLRTGVWVLLNKEGEWTNSKPPPQCANDMFSIPDGRLPKLEYIATSPIFLRDKTLVCQKGYHSDSGIYFDIPRDLKIPMIPDQVTLEDCVRAKSFIDECLADFRFVSESDRVHAIALMVLPVVRPLIDGTTPLHGVEASTPGSGKGLLIKSASIIGTGELPEFKTLPSADDEIRKMLTSELSRGRPIIVLDNVPQNIVDSSSFASILTSELWSDRLLGYSKIITSPNRAVWILSGNNPQYSTEISRRVIRCRIDPECGKPWLRPELEFRHPNLIAWVKENRGVLLWSIIVLVKLWIQNGCPKGSKQLGSFESWSIVMGGILENAGIQGFLGNLNEVYEAADPIGEELEAFIEAWFEEYHFEEVKVSDLCRLCQKFELLLSVLRSGTDRSQQTQLGILLRNFRGRIFGNCRIEAVKRKKGHHGSRYYLSELDSHNENLGNLGSIRDRTPSNPETSNVNTGTVVTGSLGSRPSRNKFFQNLDSGDAI